MRHIKTASKQIWIAAVIIMALILSVACTAGTGSEPDSGTEAETTIISGQVVLTDGTDEVALPDGSQIIVQVQDTSRADAPAVVLGEQIIINAASLPAAHEISVESAELEEVVQASVAVRVEDAEGQLLYINDTIHPVSAEETAVDVAVIAVAAAESESALPPPLLVRYGSGWPSRILPAARKATTLPWPTRQNTRLNCWLTALTRFRPIATAAAVNTHWMAAA